MDFRAATDLLGVKLAQVAEALGKSEPTTLAYRGSARKPPPEVMLGLAQFMREHAQQLLAAADQVERAVQMEHDKRMERAVEKARERAGDRARDRREDQQRDELEDRRRSR